MLSNFIRQIVELQPKVDLNNVSSRNDSTTREASQFDRVRFGVVCKLVTSSVIDEQRIERHQDMLFADRVVVERLVRLRGALEQALLDGQERRLEQHRAEEADHVRQEPVRNEHVQLNGNEHTSGLRRSSC